MFYLVTVSAAFGSVILVILLALFQLDDHAARMRLQASLIKDEKLILNSFHDRLQVLLESIPTPDWFGNTQKSKIVTWSGIRMSFDQFRSAWWLTSWSGLMLGFLTTVLSARSLPGCLLGALLCLAGCIGPILGLQHRISLRKKAIEHSLPDFLDLLTITLEAGLGLVPALKRVVSRFDGPLSKELEGALQQIQLGYSQREALRGLIDRIPSSDVEHLVEAILLAERLGTSLARSMRIQSSMLRTRRRQRAQVQAQTTPVRIIPALVFFFLPSLLLIYLAPPIISFLLNR